MIDVLIVDDEPLARENVRALLERDPDVDRIDECGDGRTATRRILDDEPDVVFLDVQMPGVDGLAVLQAVGPERMPAVVFVTAHDEYALRAFDAAAVDYLVKPFSDRRFERALDRAKRALTAESDRHIVDRLASVLDTAARRRDGTAETASHAPPGATAADTSVRRAAGRTAHRIAVPDGETTRLLDPAEIDWIEAADYYARLHVGDRAYLLHQSLTELEARLDADRFVRIHRSAIVRVDRIQAVRPAQRGAYEVVLRDGTRLRLSRRRRAALERLVGRLA